MDQLNGESVAKRKKKIKSIEYDQFGRKNKETQWHHSPGLCWVRVVEDTRDA